MDKFELNYANTEYSDRHKKSDIMNKPKQTPIEWHSWDELVSFFKGYFEHFGDDIAGIDEDTFKRMVKTIWRFSQVVGFWNGMEFQKSQTPSLREQLKAWFKDIQRYNESEIDETFPDTITPNDIWHSVLGDNTYSEDSRAL